MTYSVYQPSGVVPPLALVMAAGCLAVTLPAAALYAWLIHQLPFVFNFFISFAFAFVMASLVKRVCATAKVRNPRWCGWFGTLLGFGGWYFQWVTWVFLHPEAEQGAAAAVAGILQFVTQPAELGAHVMEIISPENSLTKSVMVTTWIGELWVLLFFPHYMGKMRAEELFDEAAGEWAGYEECPKKFRPVGQAALLSLMSSPANSLQDVLSAEPQEESRNFSRLRVYHCKGGDTLVSIVTVELRGVEGRERVIESWPGKYLYVSQAELDKLLAEEALGAVAEESDPPELVVAINQLRAQEYQSAYEEALPFISSNDNRLYCDANRLCAIVCSETGQWTKAVAYWQGLYAGESTAHNALQAATSAIMADKVEQGLEWAERARELNMTSNEMPDIAILTNMLTALTRANHMDAALPLLEQLKDVYARLHVTDPSFLFGHRAPLFHVFLEKSGAIVNKVLGEEKRREWYTSMLPHLDERGKAELLDWLDRTNAQV